MSTGKSHIEGEEKPSTAECTKKEDVLNIVSNIASVAGVTATIIAAVELSLPIMVVGTVVGAAAAITKLVALRQGTQQGEESIGSESSAELTEKKSNENSEQ
jgi:hypothetical protein